MKKVFAAVLVGLLLAAGACNNYAQIRRSAAPVHPAVVNASPSVSSLPHFPVWKTVTLGNYYSIGGIRAAFKYGGFQISDQASSILDNTRLASQATAVDLVKVTVAELGFPKGSNIGDIYAQARERGLELCPAEVGPVLRLAYTDQPLYKWLAVGMGQTIGPDGYPNMFSVVHLKDGLWLYDYGWAKPADHWTPDHEFVFCLRK